MKGSIISAPDFLRLFTALLTSAVTLGSAQFSGNACLSTPKRFPLAPSILRADVYVDAI